MTHETNTSTYALLHARADFTLRAAADVVPADLWELLFVFPGSVGTTAAVICGKDSHVCGKGRLLNYFLYLP